MKISTHIVLSITNLLQISLDIIMGVFIRTLVCEMMKKVYFKFPCCNIGMFLQTPTQTFANKSTISASETRDCPIILISSGGVNTKLTYLSQTS